MKRPLFDPLPFVQYNPTRTKEYNNSKVAYGWQSREYDWNEEEIINLTTEFGISGNEFSNGHRTTGSWVATHAVSVYPNPVRSRAMLRYQLPVAGPSSIIVHNLLGQEVRRISLGHQAPGVYQLIWDGNDNVGRMAANGVYFITIQVGSKVKTGKVSILR